jgi:hypothetical protein
MALWLGEWTFICCGNAGPKDTGEPTQLTSKVVNIGHPYEHDEKKAFGILDMVCLVTWAGWINIGDERCSSNQLGTASTQVCYQHSDSTPQVVKQHNHTVQSAAVHPEATGPIRAEHHNQWLALRENSLGLLVASTACIDTLSGSPRNAGIL